MTDVAIRVVAGVLAGDRVLLRLPAQPARRRGEFQRAAGRHPDVTANGIATKFPFLPTPLPGRR